MESIVTSVCAQFVWRSDDLTTLCCRFARLSRRGASRGTS